MSQTYSEREILAALETLHEDPQPIIVHISKAEAFHLLSAVQLAARHPLAAGTSTLQSAAAVVRQFQAAIAPDGPLAQMAEMGWNSQFDEEEDMYQ